MQISTLRIAGLASAEDVQHLASHFSAAQGIQAARPDLEGLAIDIDFDAGQLGTPDLLGLLQQAGFNVAGAQDEGKGNCCGGCCGSPQDNASCA